MTKRERELIAQAERVFNAYGSYAKWLGTGGTRQATSSAKLDKELARWNDLKADCTREKPPRRDASNPVWWSVFTQARAKGLSRDDARDIADRAARDKPS